MEVPDTATVAGLKDVLDRLKKELKVEMALNPVETDEL